MSGYKIVNIEIDRALPESIGNTSRDGSAWFQIKVDGRRELFGVSCAIYREEGTGKQYAVSDFDGAAYTVARDGCVDAGQLPQSVLCTLRTAEADGIAMVEQELVKPGHAGMGSCIAGASFR